MTSWCRNSHTCFTCPFSPFRNRFTIDRNHDDLVPSSIINPYRSIDDFDSSPAKFTSGKKFKVSRGKTLHSFRAETYVASDRFPIQLSLHIDRRRVRALNFSHDGLMKTISLSFRARITHETSRDGTGRPGRAAKNNERRAEISRRRGQNFKRDKQEFLTGAIERRS